MSSKKPKGCAGSRLCADFHPDDGPPSRRRNESREDQSTDRKTLQLCAQVKRSLQHVIPVSAWPELEALMIEAVEPAPDASRLRVALSTPTRSPAAASEILHRLATLTGRFRAEVAMRIHRKKVPVLVFELVPRESDKETGS